MTRTSVGRPRGRRVEHVHGRPSRPSRPRVRKAMTGAGLRRRFAESFGRALECLDEARGAREAGGRRLWLERAHEALLVCLEMRPGNHVLRRQARACQETLEELQGQGADEACAAECPVLLERDWKP